MQVSWKTRNENEENNTLFVDSLKGSLTILLFTNQELQIANQFDTNGDEDALYYLLLTLEQSKVKVETLQVILSSTASFKTKLDKYFNKITITSSNKCDLNITEGGQSNLLNYMRIIRGTYKGHRLTAPKAIKARPTTDFAKEGLFNILENKIDIIDATVLDLFTGTGNLSFEFTSRGAKSSIACRYFAYFSKVCKRTS